MFAAFDWDNHRFFRAGRPGNGDRGDSRIHVADGAFAGIKIGCRF